MEEILFKQISFCVECSKGLKKFCDLFLSLWMIYKEKLCELEIDLVALLPSGLAVGASLGVFMIVFRVRELWKSWRPKENVIYFVLKVTRCRPWEVFYRTVWTLVYIGWICEELGTTGPIIKIR